MNFTIPIYESTHKGGPIVWRTIGLGRFDVNRSGRHASKIRSEFVKALKKITSDANPAELLRFEFHDMKLRNVRLDFKLKNNERVTGSYPIVLSKRYTDDYPITIAFHPLRPDDWFIVRGRTNIDEQANAYFKLAWKLQTLESLEPLKSPKHDRLKTITFRATPRTLLSELDQEGPSRKKLGPQKPAKGALRALPSVGVDLSTLATDDDLEHPRERARYREELNRHMQSTSRRAVVLIGPSGVGKRSIILKFVHDHLVYEDFANHGDVHLCERVWSVSGRRVIAGMSYIGQWEERCVNILEDLQRQRGILYITDIHAWGQIGQSTSSDRCLADFFRGPIARGECAVVASCTPERWMRLEADAPAFAALFDPVYVQEPSLDETFALMMDRVRRYEATRALEFKPTALRTILELGESVLTNRALPGKAIETLDTLADEHTSGEINAEKVFQSIGRRTGIPDAILKTDAVLDLDALRTEFSRFVRGQDEGVDACIDVIGRIKAGLCEPRRPYHVMMFTGPTGTGKTELAKCLAAYMYGDVERLVRFDMSEFSGPDAVSRLAGDRFDPDGLLTGAIRKQPFAVVLLDEIEKAHPSALNLLLQVFDEGRLADAAGRVADFTHAIIVLTSNLGATATASVGFGEDVDGKEATHDFVKAVEAFFAPELFNRIDRVVGFRPLDRDSAERIALKELQRMLARHGLLDRRIFVKPTDAVLEKIVRDGFDKRDGARSLKRFLEQTIGAELSDAIARGGSAYMRFFHAYVDHEDAFAMHADSLKEAEMTGYSEIEALLEAGRKDLTDALVESKALVADVLASDQLATASETMRARLGEFNLAEETGAADAVYAIDTMRHSLETYVHEVDYLLGAELWDDEEVLEGELMRRVELKGRREFEDPKIAKWFNPGAMSNSPAPPSATDVVLMVAESRFLKRALEEIDHPEKHQVIVVMSQIGDADSVVRFGKADQSLVELLATSYAGSRGFVTDVAGLVDDEVVTGTLSQVLARSPKTVALSLVGFAVSDWFASDHGCHTLTSAGTAPQVVRVEVRPYANPDVDPRVDDPARRAVETLLKQRKEFLASLADGGDAINPEPLMPIIRTYSVYRSWTAEYSYAHVFDNRIGWFGMSDGIDTIGSVTEKARALNQAVEFVDG